MIVVVFYMGKEIPLPHPHLSNIPQRGDYLSVLGNLPKVPGDINFPKKPLRVERREWFFHPSGDLQKVHLYCE